MTGLVLRSASLETLRAMLPVGLHCLPREPGDEESSKRSRVDPAGDHATRNDPPARGLHVPRQGTLKVSSRSGRSLSTNQIDPPARGLVVAKTTSGNRPPPHQRDVEFLRTRRQKSATRRREPAGLND